MRSVVKHSYIKTASLGLGRAKAHLKYIQHRGGKDKDIAPRQFFGEAGDEIAARDVRSRVESQTDRSVVVHKLIVSPGVPNADVRDYTREIMAKLSSHKGVDLEWYGVVHANTDNPHAHIVIMPADRYGRRVKLTKDDYAELKKTGDDYLIRNKLWSKDKEAKEKADQKGLEQKSSTDSGKRRLGERIVSAVKAAKAEFLRKETREEVRRELVSVEEASLGKAPTWEQISENQEEADRKHKEEVWKTYSKPIVVKSGKTKETVTWTDNLSALRKFETRLSTNPKLAEQLTEVDRARLSRWIKDSYAEEKALERKASLVEKIEVEVSAEKHLVISDKSSLAEIREILKLNSKGTIALPAHEILALEKWKEAASYQEPIYANPPGAPGPVSYDKEHMVEALKFLAKEYEQDKEWAKTSLNRTSYRKLRGWIKDKEKSVSNSSPEGVKEKDDK